MNAIVSLSGGIDSAVVLAKCLQTQSPGEVLAVGFYYGSKHNAYENLAARSIADHYGIAFQLLDLSEIMAHFRSDLLLSGGAIPEGHYAEESMKRTVVPFRNGIFCSILAGLAGSVGAKSIWLGVHAGDHAIYSDCRPEFICDMRHAIQSGLGSYEISLIAPFLHVAKNEIVKVGMEWGVPFHLCRTCYQNQDVACGRCGSCCERLEAFNLNGAVDPILYESQGGK